MSKSATGVALAAFIVCGCQSISTPEATPLLASGIVETKDDNEVLQQEVIINASTSDVWDAFTTSEGYTAWASPFAHIEFGVEGFIESSYELEGELGREGNIRLRILAYIPQRLLVLKTDKAPAGFGSEDMWERLVSVFEFLPTNDDRTRLIVSGIGYGDDEESEQMKAFFVKGNAWSLKALNDRFENGPTDWPAVFEARSKE